METDEELYKQFVKDVHLNLKIVVTLNPNMPDYANRIMSAPALYNRCDIDWFGDWPDACLLQVAAELTKHVILPEESLK